MLKETITYNDFDGISRTENVYFNLTKAEILDNMHLQPELESLAKRLEGDGTDRSLSIDEVREVVEMVKSFGKLSYGIRSDDGKRFIKGPEIWEAFTQTAAYDAWLMSMFQDVDKATKWLANIMPTDLRQAAEETVQSNTVRAVNDVSLPEEVLAQGVVTDTQDQPKSWMEYTEQELLGMDDVEFAQLMVRSREGRNIPQGLQVIGMKRMNGAGGKEAGPSEG